MPDASPPGDDSRTARLSLRELLSIAVAGHLGVRKRHQRESDFERADGRQVFAVAALYFAIIVAGLIALARYLSTL